MSGWRSAAPGLPVHAWLVAALLLGPGAPLPAAGQNAPSLTGVGDLPGGAVESSATAVSADASTVVGNAEATSGTEAFRWTVGGGIVSLGAGGGSSPFSNATDVSDDGSVIAGTATNSSGGRAFRWTSGSGYTWLNGYTCFLCDPATTGVGLSGDGNTVVGSGLDFPFLGDPEVHATRWVSPSTSASDLGDLPGGGSASAGEDASANGSVIVGSGDTASGNGAFYWTSGSGMQQLPGIPGMMQGESALAISGDASLIAGSANNSASHTNQMEPVIWTGAGYATLTNLGALPGQTNERGKAFDTNSDGSIVVGTTRDLGGNDVAFLWDAVGGMRSLATELEEEYGLDLGGWQLHEARGVSDTNAFGEFVIVGAGTNPSGDPEGFVALLSPTACNDGLDNEPDGATDFPADPGCTHKGDRSEVADCDDGLDNDGDGLIDLADPECTGSADGSEEADCSNGFDDDGDGLADWPADPGCKTADSPNEEPECDNGVDDDGDGDVDAADAECLDPSDTSERVDCDDAVDNDGDGLVDLLDPDCTDAADGSEAPACFDFVDNDGDGRTDYPSAYPRCTTFADATEAAECTDGTDNDADTDTDFPADAQCGGHGFDVEDPPDVQPGDLLVVDRGADALYAIDPGTGASETVSLGGVVDSPEGVAVRADGRTVAATPAGLFEVAPATGLQTARSGGFVSVGSLPIEVDSTGDFVVLDHAGIHAVTWNPGGLGSVTPLISVPVGGGDLQFFVGHTLVLESDTIAYTTGFGNLGDGVFRVDLAAGTVTKVTPGFQVHAWRDMVLEDANTLLAVGRNVAQGEGVYRIEIATGNVTTLTNDAAWQQPDGVVTTGSDIYVADSGTCDENDSCSGGEIVRVDPVSGARTVLATVAFSGLLDLTLAGAAPVACANGIDDDGDGLDDWPADPGCASAADTDEHNAARACDDGIDNDGDGLYDWPADPGCRDSFSLKEDPACDDDVDNDGDGGIDFDGGTGGGPKDWNCLNGYNVAEKPAKRCGLGFEIALLLPALWALRRARRRT